jgi:hypothetical protein
VSVLHLNANPNADVRNPDWCVAKFLCSRRCNQCHSSTHCVWNRLFLLECGSDYSEISGEAVIVENSDILTVASGVILDAR